MAFWNRRQKNTGPAVDPTARVIVLLRQEVSALRDAVAALHQRADELRGNQPVPTNGKVQAGSAVQDWLPVLDRAHEIALVAMGHPDLAQAFGAASRQKEYHQSEPRDVDWVDPNESTYENV